MTIRINQEGSEQEVNQQPHVQPYIIVNQEANAIFSRKQIKYFQKNKLLKACALPLTDLMLKVRVYQNG